ncbi:FeoC-like transcriptional regulator [Cellulomonas chengniuliangii]|uniref:FeoC-like transcriptional regulator n=1 Tax=Cellulomonas chengniuliangii TaxID=2968084 RepID=A0ABY5L174_9CELL|nr:FeoC-like transcriptional regulator [Cellulomonas chengniuliangii]MCC2307396.1 FeoC-like transcriptional regulator [Cellulomonas chengniuliangii]MCC2318005.1 FeoC-like transcriptional regulator [Cellulomonas chengniuliangii]UUI75823.1 FeoC-like transcriptional regulator [Cellulomonas chengniuliangii]
MSVLADVLREARTGATSEGIARRLGIDPGLAEAMVDHWARLGVVHKAHDVLGCSGGCPAAGATRDGEAPRLPIGCAGCPMATLPRA